MASEGSIRRSGRDRKQKWNDDYVELRDSFGWKAVKPRKSKLNQKVAKIKKETVPSPPIPTPKPIPHNPTVTKHELRDINLNQSPLVISNQQQPETMVICPKLELDSSFEFPSTESSPTTNKPKRKRNRKKQNENFKTKRKSASYPVRRSLKSINERSKVNQMIYFDNTNDAQDIKNEVDGGVEEGEIATEIVKLRVITVELECPIEGCGEKVGDRFQLAAHYVRVHKIEPFRCMSEGCGETRETEGLLGMHIRFGHRNQTTWPCRKCDGIYRSHNLLYKHDWDLHFKGQFRCAFPGCTFGPVACRNHVRTHYTRVHDAGKYPCLFCTKVFNNRAAKTIHERSHTGTKPFRCRWPNCTQASAVKCSLVTHIRCAHLKIPRTLHAQKLVNKFDPDDIDKWIEVDQDLKNMNFSAFPRELVKPVIAY